MWNQISCFQYQWTSFADGDATSLIFCLRTKTFARCIGSKRNNVD